MKTIAILFILLFSLTIHAQDALIKGVVTDIKTNEPLLGATIIIGQLGCIFDLI